MTDSTEKWDKKNFRVKEQGDCLLHKKKQKQKQKQNKTKQNKKHIRNLVNPLAPKND